MGSTREPWPCARCGTLNLSSARSCRRCAAGRPILLRPDSDGPGAPGFAAILSGLLPGLGQIYQERWIRGVIVLLIPVLAIALGGAFIATLDPITSLVVRNAVLFTLLVVGGLLAYHLWAVADAFASGFRGRGRIAGHLAKDYIALGLVALLLIAAYGGIYRGATAWAGLAARVFAPVGGATTRGAAAPWEAPPWNGTDRLNVLVLGIDSRGGQGDTQNTDTLIVLSIDPVNRTAAMLSIPRDTLVTIPKQGDDKINAAYAYGGPELAVRTVEGLLGIRLNSYALIDFTAFTHIVDAVGGALIDVKRPIRDEAYPTADYGVERLDIFAGPQLMTGAEALKYARSRHDSNDFSRARRQQEVIAAIRLRLGEDGALARVPAIVGDVGSAVETNFDPANILPLAGLGSGIPASAIRSEVLLPCGGDSPHCELIEQNSPGGYYLIPDRAKIANLVAELFYDPRIRQEAARVEVRGVGVRSSTAPDAAERLTARAFAIQKVTSAPAGTTARSMVVLRNAAKRYTADQLAKQLGGIPVRDANAADTGDADVLVLIGSDFRGFATDLQR